MLEERTGELLEELEIHWNRDIKRNAALSESLRGECQQLDTMVKRRDKGGGEAKHAVFQTGSEQRPMADDAANG
jgi:hypothetical protein